MPESSAQSRPDWWPTNPYFPSIFTMTENDIVQAIPDDKTRTGVAGKLMHDAWELASEAIWEHFKANGAPEASIREALRLVSKDMHTVGSRPCSTCQFATNVLNEPFGCTAAQVWAKQQREGGVA